MEIHLSSSSASCSAACISCCAAVVEVLGAVCHHAEGPARQSRVRTGGWPHECGGTLQVADGSGDVVRTSRYNTFARSNELIVSSTQKRMQGNRKGTT